MVHRPSRQLAFIDEDEPLDPLFPLTLKDYFGFSCAVAGLMLAAGGGIGGGGLLVPIYILILDFPVKHAIPLASVTVLGGAIANNILTAPKKHPDHPSRPVIDWDLLLQLEPMTILGALIGVELNEILPDVALVVLLLILLSFVAYKTIAKANKLHEQETMAKSNEKEEKALLEQDAIEATSANCYGTVKQISKTINGHVKPVAVSHEPSFGNFEKHEAWLDAVKLTGLFCITTTLNLLKGGTEAGGGPLGLAVCGATCFWVVEVAMLLLIVLFAVAMRFSILNRIGSGGPVISDIEWNERNTISYPAMAIVAGLVAGLFGVGGGIIKGPLMLALGE